jgi:hypothetical protein
MTKKSNSNRDKCSCHKKRGHCKSKKKCQDPIVGTWTVKIDLNPIEYANWVFSADGTFAGHDTGAISGPGIGPVTGFATTHTGQWKNIGGRNYKMFIFNALALIGPAELPPPFGTIPPWPPATLAGWLPVTFTGTMSKDGKTMDIDATANFYDITNVTFSTPPGPIGPPNVTTGHMHRITFETLGI